MDNSLHNADDLLSSGEAGYSATVAAELQRAYARIKRGQRRVERSHATGGKAHAWLNRPMSARQRMRALYVLAMDHAADRTFMPALEYLEDGLDVAAHLADRGALAELAYLHAAISFAVAQYRTARVSYGVCIDTLRASRDGDAPADPTLEVTALVGLGATEFLRAQHEAALRCVDEAGSLLALAPDCRSEAAKLEWIRSQLYRWRGQPERGLRHALAGAEVLSVVGPRDHFVWAQTAIAENALDLADAFPSPVTGARDAFAELASRHTTGALMVAREIDHHGLEGYALLIKARLGRVLGRNENRIAAVEGVLSLAHRIGDVSLSCRAHTALGDEYMTRNETEVARACYRRAVDMVTGSDVQVSGARAQRALLRMSEMRVD